MRVAKFASPAAPVPALAPILPVILLGSVLLGSTLLTSGEAAARRRLPVHPRQGLPAPSADAVDLGTLAPPTRLGTLRQTYGDAAIARARLGTRDPLPAGAERLGRPFPCEPRAAGAGGYRCGPEAAVPGYGLAYTFDPAYVSSPNVSREDPGVQAPVLPAVTGLFWAVNGLGALHRD